MIRAIWNDGEGFTFSSVGATEGAAKAGIIEGLREKGEDAIALVLNNPGFLTFRQEPTIPMAFMSLFGSVWRALVSFTLCLPKSR